MSINNLQDLFKVGITKEEFIAKANQIKSQNGDESIFAGNSVEEVFDLLNTTKASDGKEVLDTNEIQALANFDKTDGDGVISEKDLTQVYNKLAEKVSETLDTPENMLSENASVRSDYYGEDLDDYIMKLTSQISSIENLIITREENAENIIQSYNDKIEELINKSKSLDAKFKSDYKKTKSELEKANNDYEQNEQKIKQKSSEIDSAKKTLEKYQATDNPDEQEGAKYQGDIDSLTSEYNGFVSNQGKLSSKIGNLKNKLTNLQNAAISKDKELSAEIKLYQDKIKIEEASLKSDIENYNSIKDKLVAAKEYATAQIGAQGEVDSDYSDEDTENWTQDAADLKAKWEKKGKHLSDGFYNKVVAMAKRLNCDPNALMGVMNAESGLNAQAVNKSSGATGLIQFMPSTAKGYGTSTSALRNMSAEQQLVYVEQYLTKNKKAAGFANGEKMSAGQIYALVFLPARAKRDVLTSSGEKFYSANKGLDKDHDGKITKSELDARAKRFMA